MANDDIDDSDDNWEEEDEEAWDEDDEDDLDDPIYDLQAVRLRPGQKRHLATELRETLCGREMGYQSKELRGFDTRDCQRCYDKAIALHLCCVDCDKPLLIGGLSGRCRSCQARYEKLVAKGIAGDAPTAEVLKQRRVAAAETAYEQTQRKRERKAQAEYEADWCMVQHPRHPHFSLLVAGASSRSVDVGAHGGVLRWHRRLCTDPSPSAQRSPPSA